MAQTKEQEIKNFLEELTILSKKYNIRIESSEILFLSKDGNSIADVFYDSELEKYIP